MEFEKWLLFEPALRKSRGLHTFRVGLEWFQGQLGRLLWLIWAAVFVA